MRKEKNSLLAGFLFLAICLMTAQTPPVSAHMRDLELRAGTVFKLSMDTYLTSRNAQVGDPFTATVFEEIRISGETIVPRGAKIEGKISSVTPAQRPSKSGTLAVEFESLRFPNGRRVEIEGQLTSLDAAEKQQIDEEGRVSGGSSAKRNVVFIGGGAAGGAVIGAVAGGGKGTAVGATVGAVAGVLGSVISKGEEAQVQAGQKFGMELLRAVRFPSEYLSERRDDRSDDRFDDRRDDRRDDRDRNDDRFDDRRDNRNDDRRDNRSEDRRDRTANKRRAADLKSQVMIRQAQSALKELGYYKGPVNGVNSGPMRASVRTFQRDYDLDTTGELNFDTAFALGLVNEDGVAILPVRVLSATAERASGEAIRVKMNTEANTGGWDVFADTQIDGDILDVYVKGTPPDGIATQAITRYPVEVTVRNASGVSKVVVHGEGNPVTVELASLLVGISQELQQQATAMFDTYKEAVGVGRRGSNELRATRLTQNQAEVLNALNNLSATAELFQQLVNVKASEDGLRGSLNSLIRESRQTVRVLDRTNERSRVERQLNDFDRALRRLADNYRIPYDSVRD